MQFMDTVKLLAGVYALHLVLVAGCTSPVGMTKADRDLLGAGAGGESGASDGAAGIVSDAQAQTPPAETWTTIDVPCEKIRTVVDGVPVTEFGIARKAFPGKSFADLTRVRIYARLVQPIAPAEYPLPYTVTHAQLTAQMYDDTIVVLCSQWINGNSFAYVDQVTFIAPF